MLLFSTLLSVNNTVTKDDFIRLVIDWNQQSSYSTNIIPGIQWNGEHNIRYGDENKWLDIEEYRNRNIVAVRFEKKTSDGVIWDSDYVANFTERKISIRLERSYLEAALSLDPEFSTPHFISLMIQNGYLTPDDDLPVLRDPIPLTEDNVGILADVINGRKKYRLPIVFVSRTKSGGEPVDVKRLAARLKGAAHLFLESGGESSAKLRELCASNNEYFGAIGVYYPNAAVGHKRFLYHPTDTEDRLLYEKVLKTVIQYSNSQMIDPLYTWYGVNNALLLDRFTSQRQERIEAEAAIDTAKQEADSLLESADDDMRKLRQQIEDLTRTNEALLCENQGLHTKLNNIDDVPLLYFGDEQDYFDGEIRAFVLAALEKTLKNADGKTRQAAVMKDILRKNGEGLPVLEERVQTVKTLLKGYKNVSASMKQSLIDLGFQITEEGKHYKLTYCGDNRYCIIIAKTPSDSRTGMNEAAEIAKLIFL